MGLGDAIRIFGFAVETILCPQFVQNNGWRGPFFVKIPMSEGGSEEGIWPPQQSKWLKIQI